MSVFRLLGVLIVSLLVQLCPTAQADSAPTTIRLGFAECAHCLPMALTPQFAGKNVKIEIIPFTSGNDVLTALVSHSIDVAQVTYLHLVTALDRGFPVVAISGEVNGGSEILLSPKIKLAADDWTGFKQLIMQDKAAGHPMKIAASRGNAQDLHLRGELALHGIDPDKDIDFINIPNPADHLTALQRGEVDAVCTVEPFASQIRMAGAGVHFNYPYDQAAGKLTNLILTRPDVIKAHPQAVQATVDGVVKMVDTIKTNHALWLSVITKYTAMNPKIAEAALQNAYPDYNMYLPQTRAIAKMMHDLHYTAKDVSDQLPAHFDYDFLMQATGKPKTQLGY